MWIRMKSSFSEFIGIFFIQDYIKDAGEWISYNYKVIKTEAIVFKIH
jgi:hypothetical protein